MSIGIGDAVVRCGVGVLVDKASGVIPGMVASGDNRRA
jgi:hypothetical protein